MADEFPIRPIGCERAAVVEAAKDIKAVAQAVEFEAPIIQQRLILQGLQQAEVAMECQKALMEKYAPRLQSHFDRFFGLLDNQTEGLDTEPDPDELMVKLDRVSRISKRTREDFLLGIRCLKELATPAIPEYHTMFNVKQDNRVTISADEGLARLAKCVDAEAQ